MVDRCTPNLDLKLDVLEIEQSYVINIVLNNNVEYMRMK